MFRHVDSYAAAADFVAAATAPTGAHDSESDGSALLGVGEEGDGSPVLEERSTDPCGAPATNKPRRLRWYGVPIGRVPGVYTCLNEAQGQLRGVTGSFLRGFSSCAAAAAFVSAAVGTVTAHGSGHEVGEGSCHESTNSCEESEAEADEAECR